MKIGDAVIYLADRDLYGPGRYVGADPRGLMIVEFADGSTESFRAIELDTPERAHLTPPTPQR